MRTPGYIIALLFASSSIKKVKASCYAEEGGEAIADCVCHESCATCGYSEDPSADETSCITCAPGEGIELIAYWEDGTGYCNVPGPENCLAAVGDVRRAVEDDLGELALGSRGLAQRDV